MEKLQILGTKRTPNIDFDAQNGTLSITGYKSMPDASADFFMPALNWLREYVEQPASTGTELSFQLDYYNTSSGKCFVDMFKKLDILAASGHQVRVKWYYEEDDEEMYANAEDMQAVLRNIQIEKITRS